MNKLAHGLFIICSGISAQAMSQSIQLTESDYWNNESADLSSVSKDVFGNSSNENIEVGIETTFLFNNHEWASGTDLGYTQFGWYAPVSVTVNSSDSTSFSGGYNLLYNYGDPEQLDRSEPFLRLNFQPNNTNKIVLGTLEPGHQIHPAMIDLSRIIDINAEQGAQWLHQSASIRSDLWFNWREMETEEKAEEFEVAGTVKWDVTRNTSGYFAALHNHRGGQITEDHSELRNYGLHLGISHMLGFIKNRDSEIFVNYLWSDSIENETYHTGGQGVEVKYQETMYFSSQWLGRWWLSDYQGEAQDMQYGYALYQTSHLQTFGMRALHKTDKNVQIEMGLDVQMSEGAFNSSQVISVNWQHSQGL